MTDRPSRPLATIDRRAADPESGIALTIALFFSIVVVGLVTAGVALDRAHRQDIDTSFRKNGQAQSFARAGLTETVNWFRRQTSQPVLDFEPVLDLTSTPNVLDTDDAEIGLVREFRIEGSLFGRYEVWKEWDADPDSTRAERRRKLQAEDVGRSRGLEPGSAWVIESQGIVFIQNDPDKAFDEQPNRVVARVTMGAEIVRRKFAPPGQAALTTDQGSALTITSNGEVIGGSTGAGLYTLESTGSPSNAGVLSGTPGFSTAPSIALSPDEVFGLGWHDLRGAADVIVMNVDNFPETVSIRDTVVVDMSSLTLGPSNPLVGSGLVIVQGDLVLSPGSNSAFSGFLYVDGDLTINAPAEITGAVVCTGNVRVLGSGDKAVLRYDDSILEALRREVDAYRYLGSFRGREPLDV
ncbi:MAG: hypothetical protein AAF196_16360 [Planctomycetota bacterium]